MMEPSRYLESHEVPDHPLAAQVAEQMKLVEPLLSRWVWEVTPDGDLVVVMLLKSFDRSLRVWSKEEMINVDVMCGKVPYDAYMLTWVLVENFGKEFKARANAVEDSYVPIFITADYPASELLHLARLIWAGYQATLTWWGRIRRVTIPEEKPAISA